MNEERVIEILAAHADELTGHIETLWTLQLTDEERRHLAPLFLLAEQLVQTMQPIRPSQEFVHQLGQDLIEQAQTQHVERERRRRTVVISAATVGSIVSIASIVGAIVYVVTRLRARAQARV